MIDAISYSGNQCTRLERRKDLYMEFIDLKKAHGNVHRKQLVGKFLF